VNSTEYIWDFGNGNNSSITNPDYSITINNNFIEVFLTAISDEGCENTSSLILTLNETYDLYVPNTFTPDSDEHNQTWGPVFLEGFDKFNFQLLVFNRWGEIVWESKDADARWDGTYSKSPYMCPDGIYTWKILYKQKDTDEKITRTGHVTIMR
jgi:gliding motility-associated-like protein